MKITQAIGKLTKLPHKYTSAVIAVGGKGTRMGDAAGKTKQFITIRGIPVVARTLIAFQNCGCIDEIVIVANEDETELYPELIKEYGLTKVTRTVAGGKTRRESVLNGFNAIDERARFVAIHDGARCLVTEEDIEKVVSAAYAHGAAIACSKVNDTIKEVNMSLDVTQTINRDALRAAQTPQVFGCDLYRAIALTAKEEGFEATDDASLAEHYGFKVRAVETSEDNFKITTKSDVFRAESVIDRRNGDAAVMRIGHGYDVHKLVEGRKLILGGVVVPHTLGLDGHSDADVLLHAVMDAVLGALSLGDIGLHFPDSDDRYLGIDSGVLTLKVADMMKERGFEIANIDATVIAQKPKLRPYIDAMRENVAELFGCEKDRVNVKATTEEKLGFTGREEGIAAHAVVLLEKAR